MALDGCPMFAKAYMGRKDGRSPFHRSVKWAIESGQWQESSANEVKAFEKSVFGPCTLSRTWGTRPEKRASLFAPTSAPPTY
jgi:hypothetical protein